MVAAPRWVAQAARARAARPATQADRGALAGGGADARGRLQSRLAAFLKACPASVIVLEGAQVRRRPPRAAPVGGMRSGTPHVGGACPFV